MRTLVLIVLLGLLGCDSGADRTNTTTPPASPYSASDRDAQQTLAQARLGFVTQIVTAGPSTGPPAVPPDNTFELIHYPAPVGPLAAYITPDPGSPAKHPAIIWITGGDNNTIGDVWSPRLRDNDQSASAFRNAGVVMMFPSQRGGNDNPGRREGFLGEVDDILAATDYLAKLPYVDPDQIYLGGHSTGGTLAMLVAASTDRYQAVFALGPVADASDYGGRFIYCDPDDDQELDLRSPTVWLHCVQRPLYVIEGEHGNWESAQWMRNHNNNPHIRFLKANGHDHFTVIAPLTELLAQQIIDGQVELTQEMVRELR